MINTIFYFAPSFEDYQQKWSSGQIADRTICFVAGENAIYKGGQKYGGSSESNLKEQITNILNEYGDVLPVATKEKLGAIMIGDGLTCDETGKLSVDSENIGGGGTPDKEYNPNDNTGLGRKTLKLNNGGNILTQDDFD